MGGFTNAFTNLAKETFEKAAPAIGRGIDTLASKAGISIGAEAKGTQIGSDVAKHIESGLYTKVFNPQRSFQDIPAAKVIYDAYTGPYAQHTNRIKSELIKKSIQSGANIPDHEITRDAERQASDLVFGKNRSSIQAMLKSVKRTHGVDRANILADNLNILFKEAPIQSPNQYVKGKSKFDLDMARKSGPDEEGFDTPISPYKGRSAWERRIKNVRATLAYKAATIHAANTFLNVLSNDGLKATAKTMSAVFGPSRAGNEQALLASNTIAELISNGYKEKQAYDSGIIKQIAGKFGQDTAGAFIHNNILIPGMSAVRYNSLMYGAMAGKLMAEEAAHRFAAGDAKWAIPAFREMRIDPEKIKAQGYQLLKDDIDKAYFHGTNNRVFLDPYGATPTFWRQSPLWRSMKAFTGYITNQGNFERQKFIRMYQQGDFIGIARNVSMLALVYPAIGASIYEMDRLLMGEDWDAPGEHLRKRLEATPGGQIATHLAGLSNSASAAKTALNTLDMLSRLAVFGGATGYIRGANRANLAQRLLPPEANVGIQLVQDTMKASKYDKNHPGAAAPLGRDILSDIPSLGLGSIVAHKVLPSRTEIAKDKKKHKLPKRAKRKKQSMNPLNYTGNDEF